MTGKQLREFAMLIGDGATIEMRERSYGQWESNFELRAIYRYTNRMVDKITEEEI